MVEADLNIAFFNDIRYPVRNYIFKTGGLVRVDFS